MSVASEVYAALRKAGLTEAGAAGMMGNIYAESGMIPNRVEILCLKRLAENGMSYTDETYTSAVDSGKISMSSFLNPLPGKQYGYGLCQWTSPGRKAGLYNLCRKWDVSIGDAETQIKYLIQELQESYYDVFRILTSTNDVLTASNTVLTKFEMPGDVGTAVREQRYKYSMVYYEEFAKGGLKVGVHYISNSGSDENGGYHGGKAGDQAGGKEWQLRSWYNRPWNCILRHPDKKVREKIADLATKAAKNDKIGYDQWQRDTYWQQLQKVGYDPSKIKTACEADCSSGVIANVRAVGYLLGLSKLKNLQATYTGDMRAGFKAAGFTVLTGSKYLTSPDYLLPGDILLNDQHHTATNITAGKKSGGNAAIQIAAEDTSKYTVGSGNVALKHFLVGAVDPQVKTIQRLLNALGYKGKDGNKLDVDGELGDNTSYALAAFQKAVGMNASNPGTVATATWEKLLNAN